MGPTSRQQLFQPGGVVQRPALGRSPSGGGNDAGRQPSRPPPLYNRWRASRQAASRGLGHKYALVKVNSRLEPTTRLVPEPVHLAGATASMISPTLYMSPISARLRSHSRAARARAAGRGNSEPRDNTGLWEDLDFIRRLEFKIL
jgi:hypothetical protein